MFELNRRAFATGLLGLAGTSLLPSIKMAQAASLPRTYEGITLKVLFGTGTSWDILAQNTADFTKQTGIKLDFTMGQYMDRYTKMVLDTSTGTNSFDVYPVAYQWKYDVAPYLADLSNVDREVPGAPPLALDDYPKGPLDTYSMVDGKMIAAPVMGDVTFLVWNKKLYEEVGLDPEKGPASWDEVIANGKKLKEGGKFGFALPAGKNIQTATVWMQLFCGNGGKYFSESGQPQFNSPEGLAATTFMAEQLQPLAPSGNLTWDVSEVVNSFTTEQSGQALVWPAGMGIISDPSKSAAAGHFGYASPPGGGVLGGHSLGVNAKSQHIEAAKLFVTWLASQQVVLKTADAGAAPVRLSALNDPALDKKYPHFPAVAKIFEGKTFAFVPVKEAEQVHRIIFDQVNAAVSKTKSPKQANDDMQAQIVDFMTRRGLL